MDNQSWATEGICNRGGGNDPTVAQPCSLSGGLTAPDGSHSGTVTLPCPSLGWKMTQHQRKAAAALPLCQREGGDQHSWIPVMSRERAQGFQNRPWSGARMLPTHVSKAQGSSGAGGELRWPPWQRTSPHAHVPDTEGANNKRQQDSSSDSIPVRHSRERHPWVALEARNSAEL